MDKKPATTQQNGDSIGKLGKLKTDELVGEFKQLTPLRRRAFAKALSAEFPNEFANAETGTTQVPGESCDCKKFEKRIAELELENNKLNSEIAKLQKDISVYKPLAETATMLFAPPEGFVTHFVKEAGYDAQSLEDAQSLAKILKELATSFPEAFNIAFPVVDQKMSLAERLAAGEDVPVTAQNAAEVAAALEVLK